MTEFFWRICYETIIIINFQRYNEIHLKQFQTCKLKSINGYDDNLRVQNMRNRMPRTLCIVICYTCTIIYYFDMIFFLPELRAFVLCKVRDVEHYFFLTFYMCECVFFFMHHSLFRRNNTKNKKITIGLW